MGTSHSVTVGPYFECHSKLAPAVETKMVCLRCIKARSDYSNAAFCPDCGTRYETVKNDILVEKSRPEIENEDLFCANDWNIPSGSRDSRGRMLTDPNIVVKHYYLGNKSIGSSFGVSIGDDEPFAQEITLTEVAEQLQQFEKGYASAKKQLEDEYGPENVYLRWGIVYTAA